MAEFDGAITKTVANIVEQKNKNYISEDNVLHYRHGGQWTHVDTDTGSENVGGFVEHSANFSVQYETLIRRDLGELFRFIDSLSEDMHAQFARNLFSLVNETTERSGNFVAVTEPAEIDSTDDLPMLAALEEMFDKIELGVTRYGTVSYPSMFVHPSNKRVLNLINKPIPEEFARRSEESKALKETAAIAGEARRLHRYERD